MPSIKNSVGSAVAQLVEQLTGDQRVASLSLTADRVTMILCP